MSVDGLMSWKSDGDADKLRVDVDMLYQGADVLVWWSSTTHYHTRHQHTNTPNATLTVTVNLFMQKARFGKGWKLSAGKNSWKIICVKILRKYPFVHCILADIRTNRFPSRAPIFDYYSNEPRIVTSLSDGSLTTTQFREDAFTIEVYCCLPWFGQSSLNMFSCSKLGKLTSWSVGLPLLTNIHLLCFIPVRGVFDVVVQRIHIFLPYALRVNQFSLKQTPDNTLKLFLSYSEQIRVCFGKHVKNTPTQY